MRLRAHELRHLLDALLVNWNIYTKIKYQKYQIIPKYQNCIGCMLSPDLISAMVLLKFAFKYSIWWDKSLLCCETNF